MLHIKRRWPAVTILAVGFMAMFVVGIMLVGVQHVVAGEGDNLFQPIAQDALSNAAKARSTTENPTVIRSRTVTLNLTPVMDKSGSTEEETVTLNLFDDVTLTAVKDRFQVNSPTQQVWIGHIKDRDFSQVIMVMDKGQMAANIVMPGARYHVRPLDGAIHVVREIDTSAFPPELPPIKPIPPSGRSNEDKSPTVMQDDGSRIDVLVMYSADAAAAVGSIALEIALAVTETNEVYANSGVSQRIRLVAAKSWSVTETGSLNIALDDLINSPTVQALRDQYAADCVVGIVEVGDACGLGYLQHTIGAWFEALAYSVVTRSCAADNLSFAHELGHNMGAQHDCYIDSTAAPYDFSHGYVDTTNQWRTVMAYESECQDLGIPCPRIPYFSNPNVNHLGDPTGNTLPGCSADNHRVLNESAYTVANFRASGSGGGGGEPSGGGGGGGGGCFVTSTYPSGF